MLDRRLGLIVAGGALALIGGFLAVTIVLDRAEPVAAATPSPSLAAPASPRSGPITIHATGDVLLTRPQSDPWAAVKSLFRSDDLTIVNLECSPGLGGEAADKEFTFRCPKGFTAMHDSGVEVANLGNNHSVDYGKPALVSGLAALRHAGVATVGAGADAAAANEPAIFELRGRTVAVLGFGGVVPTPSWIATADSPGVADGYDTASMVAAVRAADEAADIVVVSLHWGEERKLEPHGDDVARAHAMIDAGADAIFGHHSHTLQPLRFYQDRPIFFSLGNFVWPRGGPTAVAEVTVAQDGSVSGCLLPARISGGRPSMTGPRAC